MNAAQQHHEWGVSVEADGTSVILQVGKEMVALTPAQAQRFAFYLARAYGDASWLQRRHTPGGGARNYVIEARA